MLSKKVHICDCGRKSYGFRKCQVCRSKKYADNAIKRKSEKGGESGIDERHIFSPSDLGNFFTIKTEIK